MGKCHHTVSAYCISFVILLILNGCAKSSDEYSSNKLYLNEDIPELLSFERMMEVPGYHIHKPVSLAVDSPFVFIADERDCNIAVLDWDLNFLYFIGTKGEGPGEFQSISDIDVRDGLLVAADGNRYIQTNRVSVFNYSGDYIDGFRVQSRIPPQVSWTNRNTIKYLAYSNTSNNFVFEYTISGDLLSEEMQRPDLISVFPIEQQAQLIVEEGQIYIVYSQMPRIVGIGDQTFDWTFDYTQCLTWLRTGLELLRERSNSRSGSTPSYNLVNFHSGFVKLENQLILATNVHNLGVLDLETGLMYPISTGQLQADLGVSGQVTFEDLKLKGDELLLISKLNSSLFRVPIEDILALVGEGRVLSPGPPSNKLPWEKP